MNNARFGPLAGILACLAVLAGATWMALPPQLYAQAADSITIGLAPLGGCPATLNPTPSVPADGSVTYAVCVSLGAAALAGTAATDPRRAITLRVFYGSLGPDGSKTVGLLTDADGNAATTFRGDGNPAFGTFVATIVAESSALNVATKLLVTLVGAPGSPPPPQAVTVPATPTTAPRPTPALPAPPNFPPMPTIVPGLPTPMPTPTSSETPFPTASTLPYKAWGAGLRGGQSVQALTRGAVVGQATVDGAGTWQMAIAPGGVANLADGDTVVFSVDGRAAAEKVIFRSAGFVPPPGLMLTPSSASTATPSAGDRGKFLGTPSFDSTGRALAVFGGGSVDELAAAASESHAGGVWAQDTAGTFQLYVLGGPAFLGDPFRAKFPAGFAGYTSVLLMR